MTESEQVRSAPPRAAVAPGPLGALGVFAERRTAVMLALGFAAGLPNLLIFDTLSAWLRASGLSLELISFFSLATLAYSFKFLWSPVLDQVMPPGWMRHLGQRRGWLATIQPMLAAAAVLLALTNPAASPATTRA